MRDQLIRYIEDLFASAPDTDDIRQEILQNTLDRYDDLTAQGKAPGAAYSLCVNGIGDIQALLHPQTPAEQRTRINRTAGGVILAAGGLIWLILSLTTKAWHITWLIFPMAAAVYGLFRAVMDLKEASKHES